MFALLTLAATAGPPADSSNVVRVLEYGAEYEKTSRVGLAVSFGIIGGLAAGSGTALALSRDSERGLIGWSLISGGIGLGLGGLLGLAVGPQGDHEKLLESARRGATTDAIVREWGEHAASAKSLRSAVGVVAFVFGALGFAAGTVTLFAEPSRRRDSFATMWFSFGIVESLLGGLVVSTPSPIEMTYGVYRRSVYQATARPVFALTPGGGFAGVSLAF